MATLGKIVGVLLLAAVVVSGILGWRASGPIHDEQLEGAPIDVEIAEPGVALTFARSGERVLLVVAADADGVTAVDVSRINNREFGDGIEIFNAFGYEALTYVARASTQTYAWADLDLPFDPAYPHIAAGTNFRAHAEEVGHEGDPFLFPKLSRATRWNAPVNTGSRLDYEVELCAVPLSVHTTETPASLGYVICNDFTERWTLVRDIDLDAPMGTTAFPAAKGGDTRLPIGALLVIPADAYAFYEDLELELYVNGALHQRARAGLMIWAPDEILDQAMARCDTPFQLGDETVALVGCDSVPARTLILTGTPEGVAFNPINLWNPGAYLGDGDEVISRATHLGSLINRVTAPAD